MRIDPTEWDLAKLMAEDAECSPKEVIEMAIRILFAQTTLRPNGAEILKQLASQARGIKTAGPPASHRRPRRPPKQSKKGLSHQPFADLHASLKNERDD